MAIMKESLYSTNETAPVAATTETAKENIGNGSHINTTALDIFREETERDVYLDVNPTAVLAWGADLSRLPAWAARRDIGVLENSHDGKSRVIASASIVTPTQNYPAPYGESFACINTSIVQSAEETRPKIALKHGQFGINGRGKPSTDSRLLILSLYEARQLADALVLAVDAAEEAFLDSPNSARVLDLDELQAAQDAFENEGGVNIDV